MRLAQPVERVVETGSGVEVDYREGTSTLRTVRADAGVVTCPLPSAVAICRDHRGPLEALASALAYTRTICVTVGTTWRPDCPAFMVMLPPTESRDIALFFQDHRKDPARAPAGHGLFTCYFELDAAEAPDEEVVRVALGTLERLWPGLAAGVDFTHVHHWARALPHTQVGTYRRIAEFNAALDPAGRVQFAADYLSQTGQNTAVIVGARAAANLRRHLRDRPAPTAR